MSRLEQACFGESEANILNMFLEREIDLRDTAACYHVSRRLAKNNAGIFAYRQVVLCYPQQRDDVAPVLKPVRHDLPRVFDQPDHSDRWGRQDPASFGLVVERYVARDDRCFEYLARLFHSVDDVRE